MNKIVLITGVTGYLGSHLAKALIEIGYSVVGLKRESSSLHRIESLLPNITLYDVEGLDFSVPLHTHGKINAVIHTATCYGRNGESVSQIFEANTVFPLNLLDAAINAGLSTFLNTDTSLDKYLNAYSLSKKHFRELGKYFAARQEIHFLNARLEHFYGPGDDDSKFTTNIIKSCLANVPELKLTLGEQMRDFIYIDDVVTAFQSILDKSELISDWFVNFDMGSGGAVSIKEFVETAHYLTSSKTHLHFGAYPYREGEVMFSQADIEPLQKLGWRCSHTLEQGLKLVLKGDKQ